LARRRLHLDLVLDEEPQHVRGLDEVWTRSCTSGAATAMTCGDASGRYREALPNSAGRQHPDVRGV